MQKHIKKFIKNIPFLGNLLRRNQLRILRLLPQSLVLKLYSPNVDWDKIDTDIKNYLNGDDYGITTEKRNPKIIVSLTSYPARIPRIHYTIISLLQQTIKPDEIILWLGNEQFPNRNEDLPIELIKLLDHGLRIKYCKDIRSYKKLIPALPEYPEDVIVTADDDCLYAENWLEILVYSYEQNMTVIHCHSAHEVLIKISGDLRKYNDWNHHVTWREYNPNHIYFAIGSGGILYPPHVLHSDITNESLFMKLAPSNDDIWFWAMAILNGTKINIVKDNVLPIHGNSPLTINNLFAPSGLMSINVGESQNDVQLKNVLEYYPPIRKYLGINH